MNAGGPFTLLIDADDTLWDNAVHFRTARQSFAALVATPEDPQDDVLEALRAVESGHLARGWYGAGRVVESMRQVALRLPPERRDALEPLIDRIGRNLRYHPITLRVCIVPTLVCLRRRHRVIMVTMGDRSEQTEKVERSGLACLFHGIEILSDKTVEAYHALARRLDLPHGRTWMIGNSLRKDIAPAALVGFRTVWIPCAEYADQESGVSVPSGTHRLSSFAELTALIDGLPSQSMNMVT